MGRDDDASVARLYAQITGIELDARTEPHNSAPRENL
jgi:hypothetical protein